MIKKANNPQFLLPFLLISKIRNLSERHLVQLKEVNALSFYNSMSKKNVVQTPAASDPSEKRRLTQQMKKE
jgi:hypothetical protein